MLPGHIRIRIHVAPDLQHNTLRTKRVFFIQDLSAYRAVNTLYFGYKEANLFMWYTAE